MLTSTARALLAAALLSTAAEAVPADAPKVTAPLSPCDSPQHHQFDFWVGDWRVFDASDGQLVGFDRVEKLEAGCIVQQNLTLITDLYRRPGVAYRLDGIGVNRFDGERWLELWADNQWGAIALQGAPQGDKAMVMTTLIPSRNRDLRLVWEKLPDGIVRALQYVAPAGSGKWSLFGNLLYRPNR
jgi:hypothetical protein